MKRVTITILILSIFSGFILNSQVNDSINNVPSEFFKTWQIDYAKANNELIENLPQSPSNDYEFKENRTYILYNSDGTYVSGKWSLNTEDSVIYTYRNDGELNGKITEIKKQSFMLTPLGKSIQGTPFELFRFYYKPKE